ncbi:MAG: hypothetical protein K2W97_04170 [Chthoniobacterales bacterium]|nr:hypothetical protein [Chthoniobacterales bacterium]
MNDFIKEPRKATLYYREESLRAMAVGQKEEARYWRLAADAARQVVRQRHRNSVLVPTRMPFVDNFTRFALSIQKVNEALEESSRGKTDHGSFEKGIAQEIFSHYRYWMLCLVASCSHHFEREMMQLRDAAKKYQTILPKASHHVEQAIHFFKTAQQYQQKRSRSIQGELMVGRWVSSAYEAVHSANITVQHVAIAEEKRISFLENWEEMTRCSEQALSLRIKAAESTEKQEEQQAVEYSLAAFAMSDAVESLIQMMKAAISENQFLVQQWQGTVSRALEIVEKRTALATSQIPNALLSVAVSWLEAALEADLKRVEAVAHEYKRVAFYWEESRNFSQRVAAFYDQAARATTMRYCLVQCWSKIRLRYLEKKAQEKIPIMFMEKVFFCMPEDCFPSPAWREKWEKGGFVKFAELNKSLTVHTWLYQTGTLLQQAGVNCEFFAKMPHLPHRGIVVTMSGLLYCYPKRLRFPPSLFVAGIVADAGIPHPTGMLHLIPNKIATKYLPFTEFIPHWPQPFLIPRDATRGERFETVCFMGDPQNIAPELCSKEWHSRLEKELGLCFIHRDFDDWHNFSDVDCVVAIRDFSTRRFYYKPAHKLHNAWLASVPFIGGRESAFIGDGHPGHDYLVAHSAEEVFLYLKRLKEDPVFRSKLVEHGSQSGVAFTREAVLQSWKRLVQETLPVRALKWEQSSAVKRIILMIFQRWSCEIQSFLYKHYKPKKYTFVVGKKPDLFAWASN